MSINVTGVLRHIKRNLGASHHKLELSDEDLVDIVIQESLPVFSKFFPHLYRYLLYPLEDSIEDRLGVYHLKTDFEVLGVSKVWVNNIEIGSPGVARFYQDPFDQQIVANFESIAVNPITFRWEAPDKLEIFPKSLIPRTTLVELKVIHPNHMSTIPLGMRDEFLKLSLFDVQITLLHIRKRFQTISTTFGNIEMATDFLEQAMDKREDLLEKWRTAAAKNPTKKKIFVY